MLQDAQGFDVTTRSPDAIAAINRWIDQSLGYGNAAEAEALCAIAADPTCAIAHAYADAHCLSQENTVDRQRALPYVTTAQRYTAGATTREQWYIAAIAAWSQQAMPHAIGLYEAIATRLRLELHGAEVGDRWQAIADQLQPRVGEHFLPFQNLHYVYALARSRRSP